MTKFRHVPTSNPDETRVKAKKAGGLRAIDQGTIYDVPGKMKNLARSIERGEEGTITDAVIVIRNANGSIGTFQFGPGNRERSHHMVSVAKNRLEPA